MRNLIFRYNRIFAALLAVMIFPVSCIEEPESQVGGKGQNRFRAAVDGGLGLAVFNAEAGSYPLVEIWRDVNSNSALKSGATIEFEVDNSLLTAYNASNPTTEKDFVPAPTAAVSLEGSSISYEAGEFSKAIMVTLNPTKLDLAARNAIGIRLKNPSDGYGISGLTKNGELIAEVIVKNKYAGSYNYTGHIGRYDATSCELIELGGDVQPGVSVELATTGAHSLSTTFLWATGSVIGGIGASQSIQIDPATNGLTLTPIGANPPANWGPIPGQPNRYDPATGFIYVSYKWNAPCAGAKHGFIRHIQAVLKPK
ncbi:MAG TPA: DUF1735 domain-containing protein [Chryseosolibacter sp.]